MFRKRTWNTEIQFHPYIDVYIHISTYILRHTYKNVWPHTARAHTHALTQSNTHIFEHFLNCA